jgi:hypothetical protein
MSRSPRRGLSAPFLVSLVPRPWRYHPRPDFGLAGGLAFGGGSSVPRSTGLRLLPPPSFLSHGPRGVQSDAPAPSKRTSRPLIARPSGARFLVLKSQNAKKKSQSTLRDGGTCAWPRYPGRPNGVPLRMPVFPPILDSCC